MLGSFFKILKKNEYLRIFLFVALNFNFIISASLIGEKKPIQIIGQEFKNELKLIQDTPWSFNIIDYQTYNYEDNILGQITFSGFKLEFTYFNTDKLKLSIVENNFVLADNEAGTFSNTYTFEYKTKDKQDKGKVYFSTSSMKFTKKYFNDNLSIEQNVDLDLSWKVRLVEITDDSIRDIILSGLDDFVQKKASYLIKQSLIQDINIFYDKQNLNQQTNNYLNLTGYSPNFDFNIKIAYDRLPKNSDSMGNFTIFYRKGLVNDITHENIDMPKFIFNNDSGTEIALSRLLFRDIIGFMTKDGLFDYSIQNYNLYDNSPFNLNVDYLANIIPEISNIFSRIQKIDIYNVVKSVDFDETINDKFILLVNVDSEIKEKTEENPIFKFSHSFYVELKALVSGSNLNFYFDSILIKDIKIISNGFSYVNVSLLKEYIRTYYVIYFTNNEKFYLFDKPYDFSNYTNKIMDSTFSDYGFNFLLGSKYSYVMNKEIREKALKFLGEHK